MSEAHARVHRLSEALRQELESCRMRPLMRALMTLRGVDQQVATTSVAELGELRRFAHPRELMGCLGLVPSEHTSGEKRRLGAITKTGNGQTLRRGSLRTRHCKDASTVGIPIRATNLVPRAGVTSYLC